MVKRKEETTNETATNCDFDFEKLAKAIGGEVLSRTESVKTWIDTGNLALNYLCSGMFYGGGIPSGRIIEIFGGSSSCKTLFGMNILRGVQKAGGFAVFLDAENTLSKEFAEKASHLDTSGVLVVKEDTLQKAFAKIHKIIKVITAAYGTDKPIVIVYDSIAVSPSEREYAETKVEEGASKAERKAAGAGTEQPGERARICSAELRKLNPVLAKANATVVFINQVRSKIGVMFGNPDTTAGGGRGLEYYTCLRLKTKAKTRLKDSLGNVIGMCVTVDNEKNKCFRPFIQARDMHLFFDKGINPVGGLLELLLRAGRIEKSSGPGQYMVLPAWSAGQDIRFKSSLERNDIPTDVLLQCPTLVDAADTETLRQYLANSVALEASNTDVAEEELISEEDL